MITRHEFSVFIPVYNAKPYLRACLESYRHANVRPLEIVLVDDGSTDGSIESVADLIDNRFIRVVRQENSGLTATLNRSLELCRTPWMIRQDADDLALPNRVEGISDAAWENPDATIIYTDAEYLTQSGRSGTLFRSTQASPAELTALKAEGHLLSICHPTAALNVEKVRALGGYRTDLPVEDVDLWWRAALEVYVPEVTLRYRMTGTGISTTKLREQTLATVYIQYLLLSELSGRAPKGFAEIRPVLDKLIDERHLRFREHSRAANMALLALIRRPSLNTPPSSGADRQACLFGEGGYVCVLTTVPSVALVGAVLLM